MIQGKVWGMTKLLEKNSSFEFNRISVLAGGVCSKHRHKHKWNGFFVESGELLVRVWKDYGLIDEVILEAGDYTRVAPGEYHQFEATEDTVAFELYWVEFNSDDIERETVGYYESNEENGV
jgi:mannose-6-phosphate isomerase-like protein (cupin superfamily)